MNRIISSIKNFYSSIRSNLEQLDWGTKRGIIKALIRQIDIGRDQVEIGFQVEEPAEDGKIFNLYHCTNYHDKGAGGVCQASFFVSIPNKSSLLVMQEVYFLFLINSKAFFKSMLSISAFLPKATFVLSHFI